MRIIHVIFAGLILITVSNVCLAKDWRGIIPLKSTRADVERLLGRPTGPLPTYYLSDVTVTFWYSRCRCGEKSEDDCWNVPLDTVVSIYVTLKGVNRLADLGLDLTRFKKTQRDDDVPGSFRYSNAEEGFGLEGGGDYVSALIYGPCARDEYLRCRPVSSSRQTQENDWRGIVPLRSTRADVERILGKPNGKYGRYELKDEWAEIFYSTGRCLNGWNVPEGTVISIAVSPTGPLRLSDLRIDLSNYDRFRDPHTSLVYYTHRREGIRYVVSEPQGETNGRLLTANYESTIEDERRLYCRKSRDNLNDRQSLTQAWRQIRPLRTSRKQVEKLLGRPKVVGGVNRYDFANETIDVFYLKRSCGLDRQGWNVPINTVTSVRVEPKKKLKLSETQWDLSKFRKEPGSFDNPSYSLFVNEEDGVTLSVFEDVLEAYSYGPKRMDKAKRCPQYSIAEEQRLRDCLPYLIRVECSSEHISVGHPVSCRAVPISAPRDFSTVTNWSVSNNGRFERNGDAIQDNLHLESES